MLTGDTRDKELVELLRQHGWARIWVNRTPKPWPGERWAFDTGAYRDWRSGGQFDGDAFLRRLDRAHAVGTPYMAVAPDLVAQGLRSLDFSLSWMEKLPHDWPWFLAVQDGMTLPAVAQVIDSFTGIFLGGTDSFKHTAWYWGELAHRHQKMFHYARAGTPRKIALAREVGADSADSAFPLWSRNRLKGLLQFSEGKVVQVKLWGPETAALRPERFESVLEVLLATSSPARHQLRGSSFAAWPAVGLAPRPRPGVTHLGPQDLTVRHKGGVTDDVGRVAEGCCT